MHTLLFLSLVILPFSAYAFSDVQSSDEHAEAILYMQENNIVSGYSDGTFRSQSSINRAEFIKIVMEALNENNEEKECFPDVHNEWFAAYVCGAQKKGIIEGYPDGTFRPDQTISFVEASKIITRAFNLQETPEASSWYAPFVLALEKLNAIPSDITNLSQPITRGQMSEIIFRIHSHTTNLPSKSFVELGGVITFSASSTSENSSSHSAETKENILPYTLKISSDWQNEWLLKKIEGTEETLKNVEVLQDDTEFKNFFRILFPKGTGNRLIWNLYGKPLGGFVSWINPNITASNEMYLGYYVRFPEDFNFELSGSLPGMFTGIQNNRDEESTAAVYPAWDKEGFISIKGAFMDKIENMNAVFTNEKFKADGKWHHVQIHVRLQSGVGKSNGLIDISVDGVKIGTSDAIIFENRTGDLWDAFIFASQTGGINGSSVTNDDMFIDFANFTFSNKRIAK